MFEAFQMRIQMSEGSMVVNIIVLALGIAQQSVEETLETQALRNSTIFVQRKFRFY